MKKWIVIFMYIYLFINPYKAKKGKKKKEYYDNILWILVIFK